MIWKLTAIEEHLPDVTTWHESPADVMREIPNIGIRWQQDSSLKLYLWDDLTGQSWTIELEADNESFTG